QPAVQLKSYVCVGTLQGVARRVTTVPLGNRAESVFAPPPHSSMEMPGGSLTTIPPQMGSAPAVSAKLEAGGWVPPSPPPSLLATVPPELLGSGQASKTKPGPATTVQPSTQIGLVPLAAKLDGSPTPPKLPPTSTPGTGVPAVSPPVVGSRTKGTRFAFWSTV